MPGPELLLGLLVPKSPLPCQETTDWLFGLEQHSVLTCPFSTRPTNDALVSTGIMTLASFLAVLLASFAEAVLGSTVLFTATV